MTARQRLFVSGLLCLVLAQNNTQQAKASAGLAAIIASTSLSDLAESVFGGGPSAGPAAAAPTGATATYLQSLAWTESDFDQQKAASAAAAQQRFQRAKQLAGQRVASAQVVKKTDQQQRLQSVAKAAAMSKDRQKASREASRHPTPLYKPPILLLHGGAQGGWVWSQPNEEQGAPEGVMGVLTGAGYRVYAPTLPYHEPGTDWSPDQGQLQAQDYVDYIINFMEVEEISDAIVVGHSVAGVWLQLLLGQAPDRISRLVFVNAVLLKNGESFVSNAVGPAQLFFSMVFTYPDFPQALGTAAGAVDLNLWKDVMIYLEKDNNTFAVETYQKLVPEPAGPQLEFPDFTAFYTTPMPKMFIFEMDDVSLLIGKNAWLQFAARLKDSNNGVGNSTIIAVRSDHQGMLTRPLSLAEGIIQAAILPLQ